MKRGQGRVSKARPQDGGISNGCCADWSVAADACLRTDSATAFAFKAISHRLERLEGDAPPGDTLSYRAISGSQVDTNISPSSRMNEISFTGETGVVSLNLRIGREQR